MFSDTYKFVIRVLERVVSRSCRPFYFPRESQGCGVAASLRQKMGHLHLMRWNSSLFRVFAFLFVVAMGVLPTLVQSIHHEKGNWYDGEFTEEMVNVTSRVSYAWRPGYHFQPKKNWMNDPDAPMFYMGYYHLFYQYNPFSPLWGNITWGHAVSTDLIRWKYVDDAAIKGGPGWYDILGAWSGSATRMVNGTPFVIYTGWSNVSTEIQYQTQNLVVPEDPSDPLLRNWCKSEANPLLVPEPWMNPQFFRDPTEAWKGKDGVWRMLLGGQTADGGGTVYLYKSTDFVNWNYIKEMHKVNHTDMWECPDFYPIVLSGKQGVQTLFMGEGGSNGPVKHLMKVSLNDQRHDLYTLGTYDEDADTFTADDVNLDVGIGLRYDYGKFYASKTFFDYKTGRRILWGWVNESISDQNSVIIGWSGMQTIPRQVYLDPKTKKDLIQVPIKELDELHTKKFTMNDFNLSPGSVTPITGVCGPQLDIEVQFYKPESFLSSPGNSGYNGTDLASKTAEVICSGFGGAAVEGYYDGPFGLLVLADKNFEEQTAIYFYLLRTNETGSKASAVVCNDLSRSSLQIGVDETTFGSFVDVVETDKYLTIRALVDRSIVETFFQDGRSIITSRVYPTVAIDGAAQAFLFNNGTTNIKVHSITAWEMANTDNVQITL